MTRRYRNGKETNGTRDLPDCCHQALTHVDPLLSFHFSVLKRLRITSFVFLPAYTSGILCPDLFSHQQKSIWDICRAPDLSLNLSVAVSLCRLRRRCTRKLQMKAGRTGRRLPWYVLRIPPKKVGRVGQWWNWKKQDAAQRMRKLRMWECWHVARKHPSIRPSIYFHPLVIFHFELHCLLVIEGWQEGGNIAIHSSWQLTGTISPDVFLDAILYIASLN